MNAWRNHARQQRQPLVQVPLAATYMAVRLLQEAPEAEPWLEDLLKYLHSTLGSCPSREHAVMKTVEAARHAAIPLDRNALDCLFAAGALADGTVKDRAFRCEDSLLGLGYLDLEHAKYVSTLADIDHRYTSPTLEFLPPGGFERLRSQLVAAQQPACGLVTHESSPSLLAVDLSAPCMKGVRANVEKACAKSTGTQVECRLYVRQPATRVEKAFKFRSAAKLAVQPLTAGIFALVPATTEWLLELHASSMQEAWVYLDCPVFRMVCRLPDISAPSALVQANGFSPHGWFLQGLGIPDSCCAYLPQKWIAPLTQRFWWFAATDPLVWLESTGAHKPADAPAEGRTPA